MNKYHVTDIDLYLCEIGDGDPQWQLSQQEEYVLNRRCLGRWKAKDDKDDELRRKIGAILNNTYLKKITFN